MQNTMKKLLKRTEFYIALVIVLLCAFIQLKSGLFLTLNNFIDIVRAMIVPGMLGMGAYMVIISGGFDISFPAVASLSMWATTSMLKNANWNGNILVPFLISCALGALMGALNGVIIMKYRLPTMIVTLGTSSMFTGFMHGVIHAHEIASLPEPMKQLANSVIFKNFDQATGLSSEMPTIAIMLVLVVVLVWFIMRKTTLGRSIFAIGGDISAAERIGIKVNFTLVFLYSFVGFLAGLAGMTRTILMNTCHPNTLVGIEMQVIAAAILGGTRATGGVGTVTGVLLGTALFAIVSNSLQLMGIPTYWQTFFMGALIILGTGVSAYQVMRKRKVAVDPALAAGEEE